MSDHNLYSIAPPMIERVIKVYTSKVNYEMMNYF